MTNDAPPSADRALFDDYEETYDHACHRGLALAGESRDYFAAERVRRTAESLGPLRAMPAGKVLDFGCGLGHSIPHLRQSFPGATLIGLDVSAAAIDRARKHHATDAGFFLSSEYSPLGDQQVVYSNGVFHHIVPAERPRWARFLWEILAPGGFLALWENNPWNPGTRLVMSRIPFDRDAIPVAPAEIRQLLLTAGFEIRATTFHFYFPRALSWLRPLERLALRVPLGAQYCVVATKPSTAGGCVDE